MTIIIVSIAITCVCEFIYILILKRQQKKLYHNLCKVFNDALNEDTSSIIYDESIASALDDKIVRYINANKSRLSDAKKEQNNIKMLISNISHQISTPVSNIALYSDLLLENDFYNEDSKQMIIKIKQQSDKLKFLFEVFLKTSRLESGIITVNNIKKQPVKPLISSAVSEVYYAILERKIELKVKVDNTFTAEFDKKWTKEALYNILENAIKYTEVGGKININVTSYEMFVRIDIADNGIGIKPDEYTKIFKRFYRSPSVKEYNGVGIGLYLAREVISMQGGYIKVSSEFGKGSIFSVFLPC